MTPQPNKPHRIRVDVATNYVEDQSNPVEGRFVFSYTITIRNEGAQAARLLTRHWVITDANGKVQEVVGEGVVGEQPHLQPGQGFRYSSGAILETSEQIEEKELPKPVLDAIRSHRRAIFVNAMKVTRKGGVEYQITVRGSRRTAMVAKADGTVLSFK